MIFTTRIPDVGQALSCLHLTFMRARVWPEKSFDKLYRILRRFMVIAREEDEGSPETALNQSLLVYLMEKLRELGSFSWQKAEEHLPQLKRSVSKVLDNTKQLAIPSVKKAAAQVKEGGLPQVKKGVGFVVDTTRNVVFPLVITGGNYVWETVKEHPWLSAGSLLLLLLWYGFPKAGGQGKMMKAPGRGGEMMRRSAFEGDARGYFRDLRGKGRQ